MLAIFLDSETNGLDPLIHKVIDIAFCIVDLSNGEEVCTYESLINVSEEEWAQSDPNSLRIHHIQFDSLKNAPSRATIQEEIIALLKRHGIRKETAVFVCQNPSFDRPFFAQLLPIPIQDRMRLPYHWLDLASMHWSLAIKKGFTNAEELPWNTGFSKDKIAEKLQLPTEIRPHRAINGVRHLLLCYQSLLGFPFAKASEKIIEETPAPKS